MKNLILTGLMAFLLLLFHSTSLTGQVLDRYVTNSTGTSLASGNMQLDCSVGEAIISSIGNDFIMLDQGFIQGEKNTTNLSDSRHPEFLYRVYPNPVNTWLYVTFKKPMADLQVEVLDVYGKTLISIEEHVKDGGGNGEFKLDLTKFASGIYVLKLSGEKEKWQETRLILKQ